jgi:hypothetical protein
MRTDTTKLLVTMCTADAQCAPVCVRNSVHQGGFGRSATS